MTKKEFIEKFGKCEVHFESYYKYSFTFSGKTENDETVTVSIGGDHDSIYRESISKDEARIVEDMDDIHFGCARDKDMKEIAEFYEY
jgi:hypothetical protein